VKRSRAVAFAALLCAGCAVGPEHVKPTLDLPAAWPTEAGWGEARPADGAPKGPWWQRFADAQLDRLVQQALAANPTLAVASARLAQARAQLASTGAAALPQVGLAERAARQQISANRPLSNYNSPNFATVQNDLVLQMTVGYEVDLAGRVQRAVEGAGATAEQVAADLENTRLVLAADVATAYFNLRATDVEIDVVMRAEALQRRTLALVTARRDGGAATGVDVAQQQALVDSTRVQLELLRRQRGVFEHALATLVGVPAPAFTLAADLREPTVPAVPIGVPSELLQRRPDVASAERAMAAANAQIGVARAAFFPGLQLTGAYGVESRRFSTLFDAPSVLWSLGVSTAQVLFDGGRLNANVDVAKAGHAAATANHRRVALQALQEASDGITGLVSLERATAQADAALASARRVLALTTARYEGGASAYLDVVVAQQALLASERQAAQLRAQRLLTTVFLLKALGGDWA
jgi:NodT family efflux transporter outer membrane factor (OMF) lipoprotein